MLYSYGGAMLYSVFCGVYPINYITAYKSRKKRLKTTCFNRLFRASSMGIYIILPIPTGGKFTAMQGAYCSPFYFTLQALAFYQLPFFQRRIYRIFVQSCTCFRGVTFHRLKDNTFCVWCYKENPFVL